MRYQSGYPILEAFISAMMKHLQETAAGEARPHTYAATYSFGASANTSGHLALFLSLLILPLLGITNPAPAPVEQSQVQVFDEPLAANWILPNTLNQPTSLYEKAEMGKTTVMIFWSTWCTSCKDLLPKLNQLSQQDNAKSFSFVLMNLWEDSDPIAYADKQGWSMEMVLQAEHVAQRYNIKTTPGIVVVNSDKRIVYVRPNNHTSADILDSLQELLPPR